MNDSISLDGLEASLALASIYEGIAFEQPKDKTPK
jgi:hypothetical protein